MTHNRFTIAAITNTMPNDSLEYKTAANILMWMRNKRIHDIELERNDYTFYKNVDSISFPSSTRRRDHIQRSKKQLLILIKDFIYQLKP